MSNLERAIYALSIHSPEAAEAVRHAVAGPVQERVCQVSDLGPVESGVCVLLGFAPAVLRDVCKRTRGGTSIAVVEPDTASLRARFEQEDWGDWLNAHPAVTVITDPTDSTALTRAVRKVGAFACEGVTVIDCGAEVDGEAMRRACIDAFKAVAVDTNTQLTLTQTMTENAIANLPDYLFWPGIRELHRVYEGKPAVVVSAGPSMARNIRHLKAHRFDCVIIAVQTALKPMLKAGIRPHLVCALDFHPISARFYEGLNFIDTEGVELVLDSHCTPRIPALWPGHMRFIENEFLDLLAGETQPRGTLPSCATVSHMAYYLARYMGANPVALVGQDLGFTGGLYYGAGAAIHETWGAEVNPFRTLEMFERERLARNRDGTILKQDADGRPIESDAQMENYRQHFERSFFEDEQRGLLTVDATEGGVPKAHTVRMTLKDFIGQYVKPCQGATV